MLLSKKQEKKKSTITYYLPVSDVSKNPQTVSELQELL